MAQILIFGDSTTYGAWDKKGGWVQRLREYLDEKTLSDPDTYYLIYNLGISGDTTENLLERFEFETAQRLNDRNEDEEVIFMFGIGDNDSAFMHSKNDAWVPPEKFKENIKRLIKLARKTPSKIIFIGLMPVDESKTDPIPWNTDISYKMENTKKFNEIIKSVCKEENVYFVEVFERLIKADYPKLLEDGAHPNSEGHKEISEIVKEFFIKLENLPK